jgi:hypothetical protein
MMATAGLEDTTQSAAGREIVGFPLVAVEAELQGNVGSAQVHDQSQ